MTDMNRNGGTARRRRLRPWHIVLIVVGVVAIFGGGLYAVLSTVLGPVVQSGDDFMAGLRDGEFDRAYALTTASLQRELGDAAAMGKSIGSYRPTDWSWSGRAVRNGVGTLEGAVTYSGGRSGHARLQLVQVDGQWRVEGYNLN